MEDNVRDDRMTVYEIGYLLAGLPEERIEGEAAGIKDVITKHGGTIISEEAPREEKLAYTMRKKMVSGAYDKYDKAHFGWVKFEVASTKINGIQKAIEVIPAVLRMLVTTTIRENTYLGKRAPLIAAAFPRKPMGDKPEEAAKAAAPAPAANIEEMDKSIDELVKEV
jgi:ribosomal protein S6